MTNAIAGVPNSVGDTTVMTVWPSVSRYALGRFLGKLYAIQLGTYIFRVGNLIALLTAPLGAMLYVLRLAPVVGVRYRLTNRRLIVERGLRGVEERFVDLDRFDTIEIDVRPGQAWYHAGDLIFRMGNVETFRLEAVSRPQAFRQVCLKSCQAYTGVNQALRAVAGA